MCDVYVCDACVCLPNVLRVYVLFVCVCVYLMCVFVYPTRFDRMCGVCTADQIYVVYVACKINIHKPKHTHIHTHSAFAQPKTTPPIYYTSTTKNTQNNHTDIYIKRQVA